MQDTWWEVLMTRLGSPQPSWYQSLKRRFEAHRSQPWHWMTGKSEEWCHADCEELGRGGLLWLETCRHLAQAPVWKQRHVLNKMQCFSFVLVIPTHTRSAYRVNYAQVTCINAMNVGVKLWACLQFLSPTPPRRQKLRTSLQSGTRKSSWTVMTIHSAQAILSTAGMTCKTEAMDGTRCERSNRSKTENSRLVQGTSWTNLHKCTAISSSSFSRLLSTHSNKTDSIGRCNKWASLWKYRYDKAREHTYIQTRTPEFKHNTREQQCALFETSMADDAIQFHWYS